MTRRKLLEFARFSWSLTQGRILAAAIASLIVGLTEGVSLVLLIPIAAMAGPEGTTQMGDIPVIGPSLLAWNPSLVTLLVVFVLVVAAQAWLVRAKNLFNQKILHDASDRMRTRLFESIGMARWTAIRSRPTARINSVLTKDSERTVSAIRNLLMLFQTLCMLAVYIALAAIVSWQMSLFAVAVGALLFIALFPIRRRAVSFGREMTTLYENQNQTVLDFIGGVRLAKLFTSEHSHLRAYEEHLGKTRKSVIDFYAVSSIGTVAFQTSAAIFAAVFVWMAVSVIDLDIARVVILLVIFVRLAPKFNIIQNSAQQLLNNAPAFENYRESLDHFSAAREIDTAKSSPAPSLCGELVVADVTLNFPGAPRPALDGVSLAIHAGEVTAIIGQSGSGKSTLADILLGLVEPDAGELRVDGVAIDDANRRTWRASVGSVPQDPYMMNASIRENLLIARPDATDAMLWDALDKAQMSEFIRSLPDGLDSPARERGNRFSGGERQRLALARALLRRPQLLILDEATSALDWENQTAIMKAVMDLRGELTCIVIAHRASLIVGADHVVGLKNGQVEEAGRFSVLRQNPQSALSRMMANDGLGSA